MANSTKTKTRVVNIYKAPYDIYIGRGGKGKDGYFGNPIKLPAKANEKERLEVLHKYTEYFSERLENDSEFKRRVHALKGKTLGCFCAPKLCHGDVIAAYLNALEEP